MSNFTQIMDAVSNAFEVAGVAVIVVGFGCFASTRSTTSRSLML